MENLVITCQGRFWKNKFLDISMKNDEKKKKKYLEIYSDLQNHY